MNSIFDRIHSVACEIDDLPDEFFADDEDAQADLRYLIESADAAARSARRAGINADDP